jgi:uncharacterized protein YjbI with pentapeptide repeats
LQLTLKQVTWLIWPVAELRQKGHLIAGHDMRVLRAIVVAALICNSARADIFQWEYVDPSNPSLGKKASATLCPDGAGVNPGPLVGLEILNLTKAYLSGVDLTRSFMTGVNLTSADLSHAILANGNAGGGTFDNADLSGADLSAFYLGGASLVGANLSGATIYGTSFERDIGSGIGGVTLAQVYSTASYQSHQLYAIGFVNNILSGGNFANQDLTSSRFVRATVANADFRNSDLSNTSFAFADLTGANFADAKIYRANFPRDAYLGGGLSAGQLTSTASYKNYDLSVVDLSKNLLHGIDLSKENLNYSKLIGADLGGANLSQSELQYTDFSEANLTGANFSGANIRQAIFHFAGIQSAQLMSTASYQARDLFQVDLAGANLSGIDFANFDLSSVNFTSANLQGVNFSGAKIAGAQFAATSGLTLTQIYSTASYQARDLPFVNFTGKDLNGAQLADQNLESSTFSSGKLIGANLQRANLQYAHLNQADLAGANLQNANLNNVDLGAANLTDANLAGATIQYAVFVRDAITGLGGLTKQQIYSTASYEARDLFGTTFSGNQLAGVNFSSQNMEHAGFGNAVLDGANFRNAILTKTEFSGASIVGADFTGADTRGANGLDLTGATSTNTIYPDGHIHGLSLAAGQTLEIHNYHPQEVVIFQAGVGPQSFSLYPPVPIVVDQPLNLQSGGTLQLVFDGWPWAPIAFEPGTTPALGGYLDLEFASYLDPESQLGQTIHVFDWNGAVPSGSFTITGPYAWDLSKLYTDGDVRLAAVPEPSSFALLTIAAIIVPLRMRSVRDRSARAES